MSAATTRPTLLSGCASAATAAEARFRIDAPLFTSRASRVVALDEHAAAIVRRVAGLPWSGDAHFLRYEGPAQADGNGSRGDATLRTVDDEAVLLSDELDGADVAVMVATADDGVHGASEIGEACFARGVMTAGLVVAEGGAADEAVAALRPFAMVLVVTREEDDLPEMLAALRA